MYDLDKLKAECPEARVYESIKSDEIIYLFDYNPWNNPADVDYVTFKILNLKKGEEANARARLHSLRFFSKAVKKSLIPIINFENITCCIVPSHTKGDLGVGLLELLGTLKKDIGFTNDENLLERIETVDKAASGGHRSIEVHKNSIKAVNVGYIKNRNILLFDDVTTTGSSLEACKQLLLEAGANQVFTIALGKTR